MTQEPTTKNGGRQRRGRPSKYTSLIAERICERIAEGEPLTKICKDQQVPAYRTVLGWRVANKEFQHMYARAREDAADTLADQIRELAGRVEKGKLEPNAGRVAIDALKWIASKLKPREYGDRSRMDMAGTLEVTTRPVDHMPEWMKQELEKASRSISKEAESTGNGQTKPVQ
jgi:hypothetical protein